MSEKVRYVPVLRWKKAEWLALRGLYKQPALDTSRLVPLIEPVPDAFLPTYEGKPMPVGERLDKIAEGILQNWGSEPFFLDVWRLPQELQASADAHALGILGASTRIRQLQLIPVTGLARPKVEWQVVSSLAEQDGRGAAIRLNNADLQRGDLAKNVESLLSKLNLQPEQVDLIVDYQIIGDSPLGFIALCARIPQLLRWKTFTVISGAFPVNLTEFSVGQYNHARRDWLLWLSEVTKKSLPRRPDYGDYTIRHPLYEPPAADFLNVSASIRYTYKTYWVIMRGAGTRHKGSLGPQQWLGNAMLLTGRAEFCGADFSLGDRYIQERATKLDTPGNATSWIQAGINHHLVFVLRQLASLPEPSVAGAP